MSIGWNERILLRGWNLGSHARVLAKFSEKDSQGNFKNSRKLVELMKYYGLMVLELTQSSLLERETCLLLSTSLQIVTKKQKK